MKKWLKDFLFIVLIIFLSDIKGNVIFGSNNSKNIYDFEFWFYKLPPEIITENSDSNAILEFPSESRLEKNFSLKDTIIRNNTGKYIIASYVFLGSASLFALNSLWYKDYPRSSFHFFNDGNEWLQMDKAGHITTSYQLSRIVYETINITNKSNKFNILLGSGISITYMSMIEILDGFSEQWGFSTWDFISNIIGTTLFGIQQSTWNEQKISLKYSYLKSEYTKYRPDLLGKNIYENALKDYNGQTYWLSFNISSFLKPEKNFPAYLNIALGYGADGMTGGKYNTSLYDGKVIPDFKRTRQFYISPDIDLARIPIKNKTLKLLFKTLNFIKIPAPAIEINDSGILKFHFIYF